MFSKRIVCGIKAGTYSCNMWSCCFVVLGFHLAHDIVHFLCQRILRVSLWYIPHPYVNTIRYSEFCNSAGYLEISGIEPIRFTLCWEMTVSVPFVWKVHSIFTWPSSPRNPCVNNTLWDISRIVFGHVSCHIMQWVWYGLARRIFQIISHQYGLFTLRKPRSPLNQ